MVPENYMYCLRFDHSIGIEDTWIDGEIMNYFNAQRDNIFASSSKYDIVQLRQGQALYHHSAQGA